MSLQAIASPKPLTLSLLRMLADGEFHSGQLLAEQLGISRASVHKALQEVAQYGLTLFRVRGRGYRLINSPQWLDANKVLWALGGAHNFQIEIHDIAASTNTLLLQRAPLGAKSGSVLAVEWQSAGRGRFGRVWHSGLGDALTFSVLWRFDCGLSALSGLSLAVGVAIVRVMHQLGAEEVGLKWPNDVLTRQGKMAGVLIEAQGDMLGPCAVVIGIGLNLAMPATSMIDQPVGALTQAVQSMPERNHLFALLLKELANVLNAFTKHGFAAMRSEWEHAHLYQNRSVKMLLPSGDVESGIVQGVSDEGALRIATQLGIQSFNAGEISVREG